ncbi:class I SAM-dependent methyltransferase [Parendozoicomonas haliclonae]|uniref:Tellurite resistance protein TehB n=1 Tax=Parendozoicomonas haliclonae TaxID=1960125 RepID=A0A1X7AR50_9GAMM|nr:class I SAM-dependent methyltransferase [Parendozoicomonas haliclonae]SMA50560.1 tellurite resistance protein TehB [Parendozoicomonas haliclonae]
MSQKTNDQLWNDYYQKVLKFPHKKRTEFAVSLINPPDPVAIDCGCGTGADIHYLLEQGFQVHAFDCHEQSIAVCQQRFADQEGLHLQQADFENYGYPKADLIVANNSLYFADPEQFPQTWARIDASLDSGGIFAGDFIGYNDEWLKDPSHILNPLTENEVRALFTGYELLRFKERDEAGMTALGEEKHWHTYHLVARKL